MRVLLRGSADLQEHGTDDDKSLNHVLVVGIDLQHREHIGRHADDEHADRGGPDAACASKACAAYYNRGDGVEFIEEAPSMSWRSSRGGCW